jgi:FdhD protein
VRSLDIVRIEGELRETRDDFITEEISLQLLASHRRIAVLMCSPGDLDDLVRGFFFTNGFIHSADQIQEIVVNRATWSAFIQLAPEVDVESFRLSGVIASACGAALPAEVAGDRPDQEYSEAAPTPAVPAGPAETRAMGGRMRVASSYISTLMEEFRGRSELHRKTGGVHAAALADRDGLLVFREDIGRHNAVDKVIGAYLTEGSEFGDKFLLTSGRLSSEILHKAAACALPIVVSRSAPTDRCVAAARERNITLIGFARGRRMNIYSGEQRIGGGYLTSSKIPQYTPDQDEGKQ